jgi:hypothetical protein
MLPAIPSSKKRKQCLPTKISLDDSVVKVVCHEKVKSNRSSVSCPSADHCFYYRVLPGNNTRVILNSLRKRQWFRSCNEAQPHANLIWEMYRNPARYKNSKYKRTVINHLQNNSCLVTKRGLFESLRDYCQNFGCKLASVIPLTFFIPSREKGSMSEFQDFVNHTRQVDPENRQIWILKPSSCSNRGFGISVVRGTDAVRQSIGYGSPATVTEEPEAHSDNEHIPAPLVTPRGWIVQSYMENPLLVSGRKFDIRCYVLLVLVDGNLSAYFYRDGYIRTSGRKYNLKNLGDRETHLTNDAVQKKSDKYGKHEAGNKLSYDELQDSINRNYPGSDPNIVRESILPQIRHQVSISVKAAKAQLSESVVNRSFELLGYDFMINSEFQTTLIEVNSNPCLEFACPLLEELISSLIEGVFQTAIDRFFPPPSKNTRSKNAQLSMDSISSSENRFDEIDLCD